MNRRTTIAIAVGLVLCASIVAGTASSDAPVGADVIDSVADDSSEPVETAADDRSNDSISDNMTETEFSWGTVTHETEPETGETHVEITAETTGGVSVSTVAAPNATDDYANEATDGDSDAETETFPWGAVTHATDSDTGETAIEVIVDATDDVSVSVTTTSEDGSQSTSTAVVSAAGEAGEAGANVSVSQSSVSQSTAVSSETSISIDDGDDD